MTESKKKGNLEFSLGNLFSCLCFTTEDQVQGNFNLNSKTIVDFQGDVKKEVMMNQVSNIFYIYKSRMKKVLMLILKMR